MLLMLILQSFLKSDFLVTFIFEILFSFHIEICLGITYKYSKRNRFLYKMSSLNYSPYLQVVDREFSNLWKVS